MKVFVIGAGFTGGQLARTLVAEGCNVVLIDRDAERVRQARNQLDCTVIQSDGNSLAVLEEAGIASADALVTLTEDDEINMITCSLVDAVYPKVLKIARVRNYAYYAGAAAMARQHAAAFAEGRRPLFGIDYMVNPDVEAANAICGVIEHGAVGGMVDLVGDYAIVTLSVAAGSSLDGEPVWRLASLPDWKYLVAYVESGGETTLPSGDTVLKAGDRIGVLTAKSCLPELLKLVGGAGDVPRRVVVMGAGRIGTLVLERQLAQPRASFLSALFQNGVPEREFILVDESEARCQEAAERFKRVRVLRGDIAESELIREERLDDCDLLVAVSESYERNLVLAAYLKSRGVRKTVALSASYKFDDVARKLGVDVAVPMRATVVDSIMSHLRGRNVTSVHTVCGRNFEIVSCEVAKGARAAGRCLKDIASHGEFVLLLVRRGADGKVEVPHGNSVVQAGDQVVLVMKSGVRRILQLFGGKV